MRPHTSPEHAQEGLRDGRGEDPVAPVVYVGLLTRVIAIVIDGLLIDLVALVVAGAVLVVFSVFSVRGIQHKTALVVVGSVVFAIWVISYFCVFWTTTGQTPGSRVMQIRVTGAGGDRLRPLRALIRLAGMVACLPLFWGYFPMLWSPRRRCVFDVVAGTVVTQAQGGAVENELRSARNHSRVTDHPATAPAPVAD